MSGLLGKYVKYTIFVSFVPLTDLEDTTPNQFSCAKWLKRRGFMYRCSFRSKNQNFSTLSTENCQNLALWGWDFRSISPSTLGISEVNTPYFSLEPHTIVTVNRQLGIRDDKYMVVSDPCLQVTRHGAWTVNFLLLARYVPNVHLQKQGPAGP